MWERLCWGTGMKCVTSVVRADARPCRRGSHVNIAKKEQAGRKGYLHVPVIAFTGARLRVGDYKGA